MLIVALLIAILLLAVAGIGGGIYVIGRANRAVDATYSPGRRAVFVLMVRLAGAAMVGVALMVLYIAFWTATGGPTD